MKEEIPNLFDIYNQIESLYFNMRNVIEYNRTLKTVQDVIQTPKEASNPMAYKRIPVYIGNDTSGKPIYTIISGNTQDERNDNIVKAYIQSGRLWEFMPEAFSNVVSLNGRIKPNHHDFTECAERWFFVFARPNIEESTALSYRRQLDNLWIPAFQGKDVEELTAADVQNVLNDMGDVAKDTKKKAVQVLSMVLSQAVEDGFVTKNVAKSKSVKIKGKAAEETTPYSIEEMQYLVSHLPDVKNPTDRAWLALSTLHPCRPEEVLGLRYGDIDRENYKITIQRAVTHPDRNQPCVKQTKTEKSRRTIDLAKGILHFISDGSHDDYIVGGAKPLSYQQVRRMRKRIAKDIDFDGEIVPRRFRTTVITDIVDITKDIIQAAAAAGHSNSSTTLKHYAKGRGENFNTATPVSNRYGLIG